MDAVRPQEEDDFAAAFDGDDDGDGSGAGDGSGSHSDGSHQGESDGSGTGDSPGGGSTDHGGDGSPGPATEEQGADTDAAGPPGNGDGNIDGNNTNTNVPPAAGTEDAAGEGFVAETAGVSQAPASLPDTGTGAPRPGPLDWTAAAGLSALALGAGLLPAGLRLRRR